MTTKYWIEKNYNVKMPFINLKSINDITNGKHIYTGEGVESTMVDVNSPKIHKKYVYQIALNFKREMGYDITLYSEDENDKHHKAFFYYHPDLLSEDNYIPVIGACCFRWRKYKDVKKECWGLQWFWVHPFWRRQGILRYSWVYFQKEFTPFFHPEPPYSAGTKAFFEKISYDPKIIYDQLGAV
jgi:GNAT superfamily N-acetyltransferase